MLRSRIERRWLRVVEKDVYMPIRAGACAPASDPRRTAIPITRLPGVTQAIPQMTGLCPLSGRRTGSPVTRRTAKTVPGTRRSGGSAAGTDPSALAHEALGKMPTVRVRTVRPVIEFLHLELGP